jgi:peroxiredoxin
MNNRRSSWRGLSLRQSRVFLFAIACTLAVTGCGKVELRHPEAAKNVEESARAPDFSLLNERSEPVSLSKLAMEARVVIVFYRGDWCPFCRKQLRDLARIKPELEARSVKLVAISVDPVENAAKLRDRLGFPYPLLSDPEHQTIERYGVLEANHEIAVPAVFVVDHDLRILHRQIGESISDRLYADELIKVLDRLGSSAAAGNR